MDYVTRPWLYHIIIFLVMCIHKLNSLLDYTTNEAAWVEEAKM